LATVIKAPHNPNNIGTDNNSHSDNSISVKAIIILVTKTAKQTNKTVAMTP